MIVLVHNDHYAAIKDGKVIGVVVTGENKWCWRPVYGTGAVDYIHLPYALELARRACES